MTEEKKEYPSLIVDRLLPEPHMELHYNNHVEFWTKEGKYLGQSEVHEYKGGDAV